MEVHLLDRAGVVSGYSTERPEARGPERLARGCSGSGLRRATTGGTGRGGGRRGRKHAPDIHILDIVDLLRGLIALLLALRQLEPERRDALRIHEARPRSLRVDLKHRVVGRIRHEVREHHVVLATTMHTIIT